MMYDLKNKPTSILVVEDNPFDTLVVKTLLQNHFNIITVANGYDALNQLKETKFDIILMDINLGDETMDGIKTLSIIRENKKYDSVKIFAVTAYAQDRDFFIKKGFDELLIKPVIKEEMFEFINANQMHKGKESV